MNDIRKLPTSLFRAARSLEDRFELLQVPSRTVPATEWNRLPTGIQEMVPAWITLLLASHRLAGGVLEYRDYKGPYVRQFAFFEPLDYEKTFQEGSLFLQLLPFGFVPFANEADGNVWVMAPGEGPDSAVHLLELSGWNGGPPSKANGLLFASKTLSCLLAAMAVSEASYYGSPGSQRRVLWLGEKSKSGQEGSDSKKPL